MKHLIYIGILLSFFTFNSHAQKIEFQRVSSKKFQSLILEKNQHLLIDVSRKIDRLEGHISGSVFAEQSEKLFSILDTTPPSRPILIYCKYGKRSQKAAWLVAEKFSHKIYTLKKGMDDWIAKGYKISK